MIWTLHALRHNLGYLTDWSSWRTEEINAEVRAYGEYSETLSATHHSSKWIWPCDHRGSAHSTHSMLQVGQHSTGMSLANLGSLQSSS